MTKQKLPDICNFCGKEIKSQMQYISEWFQGRSSFSDPRTRLKEKLDCCHECFLNICKTGLEPSWVKEQKNPQWISGSKKVDERYFIEVQDPELAKTDTS